jgi:hypothetical protein
MSEQNPNNNNLLNKLFGIFNWRIQCGECCGSRTQGDPEFDKRMPAGTGVRSTAASEKLKDLEPQPGNVIDKNYMENLLQGLKETYNDNPATGDCIQIQKKKNQKQAAPRWNSILEQMLIQAVNLYGTDIELLHAFFPGFKKEFIERKVKKAAKLLQRKAKWTKEEDAKLLAFINSEGTDLATIMFQLPDKRLEAIIERGHFLKANPQQPTEVKMDNELQEEDEYDLNKLLTGNTSEEYSLSNEVLESETLENEFSFNPFEAGFSFNFEPERRGNYLEFDPTPKNNNNLNSLNLFNSNAKNHNEASIEGGYKDGFLGVYENQINRMFPSKKQSFNDLLEDRSLKDQRSATDNFLDFNRDLQRSRNFDSGQNSPSLVARVRPQKIEENPFEEHF